ncbi:retrovirus-related pol polyprotein from transposon TNT 1-94 [Tanacetum coccineum]
MNQVLNKNKRLLEQVINKDIVNVIMNTFADIASVNVHECEKCLKLETELQTDFIEKEIYDKLFKSFTTLEKHCISLEVDSQLNQEIFQRDNSVSNQSALSFDQLFELNELKAQSQEKDTIIKKLKERIKSLSGKQNEDKIKKDLEEIETINIELDHRVTKLIAENEHLKQTYKQLYDSIKPAPLKDDLRKLKGKALVDNDVTKHPSDPEMLKIDVEPITPKLYAKLVQELLTNISKTCPSVNNTDGKIVAVTPKNKDKRNPIIYYASGSQPSDNTKKDKIRKPPALENETPKLVVTLVYSRKPRKYKNNVPISKSKIPKSVVQIVLWYLDSGCSKYMTRDRSQLTNFIGNVTISRVYYVEGLRHNLFFVGQFCHSNLEVAFRQHTCFIRNLEGIDLLTGSRGNNLYTMSLRDMMASSPICLLSKSSKTNKKKPHKPKSEDTNQEKLYLLHMDLCEPMRVASVNGKKYIIFIVDDYSRFTWVRIKTYNGTEFVNQTLCEYYEKIGIYHETSFAHSPQQNGVIERRNRTLIEAARTMLIYAKALLFLWAEAVAATCYT